MKKSLEILDRIDKKENIYQIILKFADKAHRILTNSTLSGSDDVHDILSAVLKETEEGKKDDEH